jgi:hypothetical protein
LNYFLFLKTGDILKKLFLLIAVLASTIYPQFNEYPRSNRGVFQGGLGLNWIDGDLHYSLRFRPEISFVNFGAGLDLRFDINKDGNLRKENFNELSDYLSIIRYLRYGYKGDPFYVKLGALDYYTLGHGSIMNRYNNSPSYDVKKIGVVMDVSFGYFGLESIYSRFAEAGVVGVRGYVQPLKFTSMRNIPVIGAVEIGASYVSDFDQYSAVLDGYFIRWVTPQRGRDVTFSNEFVVLQDESPLTIVGADISLPVLNTTMFDAVLYYDFAKIINFGNGGALGFIVDLNTMGGVTASAKVERRFNGDNYYPSYFNSLYEIEKLSVDTSSSRLFFRQPQFTSKAYNLRHAGNVGNGWYSELEINISEMFNILGSYQRLDKNPYSGILHISAMAAPEEMPFVMRAGYDKINIEGSSDVFNLDERSYLFFEAGYKPYEYILISMVYHWTFTPVRDTDKNIISYNPIKRIEPRVSFVYPFRVP